LEMAEGINEVGELQAFGSHGFGLVVYWLEELAWGVAVSP